MGSAYHLIHEPIEQELLWWSQRGQVHEAHGLGHSITDMDRLEPGAITKPLLLMILSPELRSNKSYRPCRTMASPGQPLNSH